MSLVDVNSSLTDVQTGEMTCMESRPHTNVDKAVEKIADATCYRTEPLMDRIQRLANQVKNPTPDLLTPNDERPVSASKFHLRDIELPKCDEAREIMREEALRVKMLSSAGIYECQRCAGDGFVHENLNDFVQTGGVKVKCRVCNGSGEHESFEKQGFDTIPAHDDVVDALSYSLSPLPKRNDLDYPRG